VSDLSVVLVRSRSLLAELADTAVDPQVAVDYDRVLLQLDTLVPNAVQPIRPVRIDDRAKSHRELIGLLTRLARAGLDAYELGICMALLASSWRREQAP